LKPTPRSMRSASASRAIGLEVEAVDDKAAYQPFKPSPRSSDRRTASRCRQAARADRSIPGDGKPVQVVCGAPNARAGLIGAFAEPGTYVPGIDVTLAVGKIRGVEATA
jgi:phenylalanyl-tRNA synthetase beta chain